MIGGMLKVVDRLLMMNLIELVQLMEWCLQGLLMHLWVVPSCCDEGDMMRLVMNVVLVQPQKIRRWESGAS